MMKLEWKSSLMFISLAVLCFFAGTMTRARTAVAHAAQSDGGRIFELRVYHDLPGKLPVMESRFRDHTSKLLAKHKLDVLGYWTAAAGGPNSEENTFVFLLAHDSKEEAKKNWNALIADPDFKAVEKSELGEKTLEKADVYYMQPTDFSRMK